MLLVGDAQGATAWVKAPYGRLVASGLRGAQ